jgi:VanZ family protein
MSSLRLRSLGTLGWAFWWLALVGIVWALLSPTPAKISGAMLRPDVNFVCAKTVHLCVFTTFSLVAALLPTTPFLRRGHFVVLLLVACVTEYLQTFVEGRTGTVIDACINLSGITLGLLGAWAFQVRAASRVALAV